MPYLIQSDTNQRISNKEFIAGLVKKYPQVAGHSSDMALKLMTSEGFEEIKNFDEQFISDFFSLMVRVWLQQVNISHAKDPLEDNGFGEYYDQPYGGIIQRMSVNSIKPINPGWKNLQNGDSPDPFVVRKPEVNERFYKQNFDYASLVTVPDDYAFKQIFVSEFGMEEFMAGIMQGLENGYIIQKYLMKLEALNAALNSTDHPLRETQKVGVGMSDDVTSTELEELILTIRNLIETMVYAPQTGAYNNNGFKSTQDKSRLKLLIRMGIKNEIAIKVLSSAFNPEELNLGVDVIPVPNFGGLIPYQDAAFTTQLYPVYDKLGDQIGFATTEGATTATVQEDDVFWKDPNEGVVAILADKGLVFESRQNPYRVEPIRNPRGLYNNFWASSPNNAINFDRTYNMVAIYSVTPETDDGGSEEP